MQLFNQLANSNAGENGASNGSEHTCMSPPRTTKALHDYEGLPWDSVTSLPPLDEITACSLTSRDDDDASSVSSIGSTEHLSCSSPKPKRALFKNYWEASGGRPRSHSDSFTLSPRPSSDSCELGSSIRSAAPISPASRRSIFGPVSASVPSLPVMPLAKPSFRKSKSASSIPHGKPKESCLRRSRFSGHRERHSNSDASDSSSVVTFSKKVDVVFFERPVERWAADGWDNWFA